MIFFTVSFSRFAPSRLIRNFERCNTSGGVVQYFFWEPGVVGVSDILPSFDDPATFLPDFLKSCKG